MLNLLTGIQMELQAVDCCHCHQCHTSYVQKVSRLSVFQKNQWYPASSFIPQTKISTGAYCNVYATVFNSVAQSCGWQGSGSSYTMHSHLWYYPSKNFFFSTSNHYIAACALLSICNLAIFLTPMTIMSIKRPSLCWYWGHSDSRDKTALQNSRKCFSGLLQRLPAMLEVVYWCRKKLLHRRSLASKYKYTTLMFRLSVSAFQTQVIAAAVAVSASVV